jgi:putative MATE family efflux protein
MILYAAVLRGIGETRLPFVVSLIATVVNVLVNYCLILGNLGLPGLGVLGAAIGTVVSQVLSVIVIGFLLRRGVVPPLQLALRPCAVDRQLARELYQVGVPAALDMVILNAAFLSVVGMMARIQELAVAAHAIGLRIQALAFVPGMSVSQATGAVVGQALGAGNVPEARQVVKASVLLCTGIMTGLAIVFVALAHPIVAIFDVAPGSLLESLSVLWIRVLGYGMPIVGVHIALAGMLQGAGATNTSLLINLVATFAIMIPGGYFLGFTLGLAELGVWLSFPLAFAVRAAVETWVFRRGRWARVGARLERMASATTRVRVPAKSPGPCYSLAGGGQAVVNCSPSRTPTRRHLPTSRGAAERVAPAR